MLLLLVVSVDPVDVEVERQLCERFAPRIRGYGLRHLRDAAAADDLVQHVLLAVLTALRAGRIADREHIDHYVLGTCRHAVADMRRGAQRQARTAERVAEVLPPHVTPSTAGVDRARLEHCLGGLDARDRAIVWATFVEDRDADEIGRGLALTAGNVRVIRHRALARLQACLEAGGAR